MSGTVHLLGPQRPYPNLPSVLESLPKGRIAYITAGWRHDEADDEALRRDIGTIGDLIPIYRWFEELNHEVPAIFEGYHIQQKEIRRLKKFYRLRLDPALQAVRLLLEQLTLSPNSEFIRCELDDSIRAIQTLRERFVRQSDQIRRRFLVEYRPWEHPAIIEKMSKATTLIENANIILIAGGHVGVLRNRMEFFSIETMLRSALENGKHLIAWSAGAMTLSDEIVLFHDDPPMGQRHAEILDRGFSLAPKIVVLPHARERLDLLNKEKVRTLAMRFHPIPCVGLENGSWLTQEADVWVNRGNIDSAFQMLLSGEITPFEVSRAPSP